MRRRLLGVLGALAVASLMAAPVALADPGQSGWDSGSGQLLDSCTGELVDNDFTIHFVETDTGPSHFNTHIVGIGETSGMKYVGENVGNGFVHAAPDGTFMVDQLANIRLVSHGNAFITVRIHLVIDSNGNVISGRMDVASGCHGG